VKMPEDIYSKLLVYNTCTSTCKPRNTGSLPHLVNKLGQQISSKSD